MPNAETARLIASLELKDQMTPGVNKALGSLNRLDAGVARSSSRAYKAGTQIGTGIKNSARIIAAAGIGIGTLAAGVFAKGISAASDLNETVSKIGVVFGKQQGPVLAFGKNSAAALGLSQNAALTAAGTYGNLFVSLGLTQQKASKMSVAMVKLAGDLASFNNASPEDTLLAIQSGLVGETEPLRKYGINLNDATLRQEAMALGLTKTTKEVLPPAIKAQAAYSLILKQSKTAQGDFARTSGGLANQVRILKANFTDMLATLAGPALPGVAKIFQRINAEVKGGQPAIADLGQKIGSLFSDENINKGLELLKGGIATAKEAAPIVAQSAKTTFGFVQAAVGLFKQLPPGLQGLLVGGFAVNKLTGGLITNIAGAIVETVGKSFLQRGGTPANPLFVLDVSGGLGGVAGAGAAAAGGGAAALALPVAVIAASIAGPIVAQQKISSDEQIIAFNVATQQVQQQIAGGAKLADLQKSLAAVQTGIHDIESNPLNTIVGGAALDELKKSRDALTSAIDLQSDTHSETVKIRQAAEANSADTRSEAAAIRNATVDQTSAVRAGLKNLAGAIATLKRSDKPADIERAIKLGLSQIKQGRGNVDNTRALATALRSELKHVDDPKLRAELKAAIKKVEAKLPGREFAARQLAKADRLISDGRVTRSDLRTIAGIERSLKDRGLPHAANLIRERVQEAKRAQVAATAAAAARAVAASFQTTQAVKNKDLSVTVNVPAPVVTIKDIRNGFSVTGAYSHTTP